MNGLRISEALGANIDDLDIDRGHRTLRIVRKGGKQVTVPLASRTGRALDLYIEERVRDRSSSAPPVGGWTAKRPTAQ
jgi:integrase